MDRGWDLAVAVLSAIEQSVQQLADYLWSPYTTSFFVGIIAAFGFFSAWTHLRPLRRARRKLQRFERDVADMEPVQANELSDLDSHFSRAGLSTLWAQYKAELRHSPPGFLADPALVFHREAILDQFANRHQAELVPGRLTALGVLGTFVGLTIGLTQLDVSTDSGVKSSISTVMSGMNTAFVSSICGIVASLLWVSADRSLLHKADIAISRFQTRLGELLPYESQENLLKRMADDQREQLDSFKHFASDVLIPQLVGGFREAVEPHLARTSELVEQFGTQTIENQTETLNQMVGQFVEQFTNAFGGQITELAETMKELTEWQRATKTELSDLIENIQDQAEVQQKVLEQSNRILRDVTNLSESLSAELGQFETRMDAVSNTMQTTVDQLTVASTHLQAANSKAAEQMESVIQSQVKTSEILTQLSSELKEQSSRLDRLSNHTDQQLTRLSELLGREMQSVVDHLHEGLATTFKEYDEHLAEATTRLREVVHTLYEALEDVPDEAGRIGNSIRQLRESMDEVLEQMKAALDAVSATGIGNGPGVSRPQEDMAVDSSKDTKEDRR